MEPVNTPQEKENHFPHHHCQVQAVNLPRCNKWPYKMGDWGDFATSKIGFLSYSVQTSGIQDHHKLACHLQFYSKGHVVLGVGLGVTLDESVICPYKSSLWVVLGSLSFLLVAPVATFLLRWLLIFYDFLVENQGLAVLNPFAKRGCDNCETSQLPH